MTTPQCPFGKFKNLLGAPGTGIHSYRINTPIGSIAYLDVAGSVALAYGISEYMDIDLNKALVLTFGTGIIAHRLCCVPTPINQFLFGS